MEVICSNGIVAIVEALSDENNTTLTHLDLSWNKIDVTAMVAVGRMLKTNHYLKELAMSRCQIHSEAAIAIGDALQRNTTLERLDLRFNSIWDEGATAIAAGIQANNASSLMFLDLHHNPIGAAGTSAIATMLQTNTSLTELYCHAYGAIVDALQHNTSLTMLNLDNSRCGDARSIATVLETNVSLRKLHITSCGIGDEGVVAIANALQANKSLVFMDIRYNPMSNGVIAHAFAPMLQLNATLQELHLGHHVMPIDNNVARVFLNVLQDYNDTVGLYFAIEDHHDDNELKLILQKIADISIQNRQGSRIALRNGRRAFNSLKLNWMTRTHDL